MSKKLRRLMGSLSALLLFSLASALPSSADEGGECGFCYWEDQCPGDQVQAVQIACQNQCGMDYILYQCTDDHPNCWVDDTFYPWIECMESWS